MSTVLIIGASRGIGLETVKLALDAGHRVRAFARSSGRIRPAHPNLEAWRGDALDPEQVTAALDGVDAVVQALGIAASPEMVLKPVTLFSRATEVLLPAMETAGVKRLICVTGYGAGESLDRFTCFERLPFRLFLGRAYDDKSIQERMIRGSGLDWTLVRPVILTNGPRSGRYQVLVEPPDWRGGFISRADVADFLVNQIDDRSCIHAAPVLRS